MLESLKASYAPGVLANFLIAIYGRNAQTEACRRALRQHSAEDADIAQFWERVGAEIANRQSKNAKVSPKKGVGHDGKTATDA